MTPPAAFLLIDDNPNDGVVLRSELGKLAADTVVDQVLDRPSFDRRLGGEAPTMVFVDWWIGFAPPQQLVRACRARWPRAGWTILAHDKVAEVRRELAEAGLSELTDAVVPEMRFPQLISEAERRIEQGPPAEVVAETSANGPERAAIGDLLIDRKSRQIILADPSFARRIGRTAVGLRGETLDTLHPPEDAKKLRAAVKGLCREPKAGRIEVGLARGRTVFPAEAFLEFPDAKDRDRVMVRYFDASERHAAERKWRLLAEAVSHAGGGPEFFRTMVSRVVEVLEVDMAVVVVADGRATGRGLLIAGSKGGIVTENLEVALTGDYPFEHLKQHRFICVPRAFRTKYPKAQGILRMGVEAYAGMPLVGSDGEQMGERSR